MKILHINGTLLLELPRETLTRANLTGADLTRANLTGADMTGANMTRANLTGADLTRARLTGANLIGADLTRANLIGADLTRANLTRANLTGAHLTRARLTGANLIGADLTKARLTGAHLTRADLNKLVSERSILPEGILIGWKKLSDGSLCKLRIPDHAKRVGGVIGRKCRAAVVEVLEGSGESSWDGSVRYAPGRFVYPKESFDPNPLVECASGIHFFITKHEAERF